MSAVISPCGQYRYVLERDFGDLLAGSGSRSVLFVMLNPSTADAETDDPTIRRCIGFARGWRFSRLVVANLFALRATDPARLRTHPAPVGPDNDEWLRRLARKHSAVICAWGASAPPARVQTAVNIFVAADCPMLCLDTTKTGQPRHPLYVPRDTILERWEPPAC